MSKGGAGKVYFVLYLAVVLELLIIIVERDEAEEHLLKKQKESMRIVQSILSQLQSGGGTEGMNTRPQDEITLVDPDRKQALQQENVTIREYRKYMIEVGVTDVSQELKKVEGETEKDYLSRLKKLLQLGNVAEIEYQVFYFNPGGGEVPEQAPLFLPEDSLKRIDFTKWEENQPLYGIDESEWTFLALRKLKFDLEKTFMELNREPNFKERIHDSLITPVYPDDDEHRIAIGESFAPTSLAEEDMDIFGSSFPEDSVFFFKDSHDTLDEQSMKKRAFMVYFQPPADKPGWYKLRFSSRTNRILGVEGGSRSYEELSDEETVNIGTVSLTIKDLKNVKKSLDSKLSKYGMPSLDILTKEGDVEKFKNKLDGAKKEAAEKDPDKLQQVRGEIDLYGYIARLLVPGLSRNFDQNRGSIEFNIRVIKPPQPPKSAPEIKCQPAYVLDANPPAFEFTAINYESGSEIAGALLDPSGNEFCGVNYQPVDSSLTSNIRGAITTNFIGVADKEIKVPQGQFKKYTVRLTHKVGSNTDTSYSDLVVYPTKSEEEIQTLKNICNLQTYVPGAFKFDFGSKNYGKNIRTQFLVRVEMDNNTGQPIVKEIEGASIAAPKLGEAEGPKTVTFDCNTKDVKLSIYWIDPVRKERIAVFEKETFNVKLDEPDISGYNLQCSVSGDENNLSVLVSGFNADKGGECAGNLTVTAEIVDDDELTEEYRATIVNTSPSVSDNGDFSLQLNVRGELFEEYKISGTVKVKIKARVSHKQFPMISETSEKTISIPCIYYDPYSF